MFPGQQEEQEEKQQEAQSLYQILDLPTTATTHEITKHFRRRALKDHPDKGGDPEKYRQLSEAYETLKDPEKRDLYDKYGMEGVKAGGDPNGADDIMGFFRGQQERGPKKCKPKLVRVDVTLQEAFLGCTKEVSVTRYECGHEGSAPAASARARAARTLGSAAAATARGTSRSWCSWARACTRRPWRPATHAAARAWSSTRRTGARAARASASSTSARTSR